MVLAARSSCVSNVYGKGDAVDLPKATIEPPAHKCRARAHQKHVTSTARGKSHHAAPVHEWSVVGEYTHTGVERSVSRDHVSYPPACKVPSAVAPCSLIVSVAEAICVCGAKKDHEWYAVAKSPVTLVNGSRVAALRAKVECYNYPPDHTVANAAQNVEGASGLHTTTTLDDPFYSPKTVRGEHAPGQSPCY